MSKPTVNVQSEIGTLKSVITHRPDQGIARISPKRAEELLFDDIVHLPAMQQEHDVFTQVLRAFVGVDGVLETENLIQEALDTNPDGKAELLNLIVDFEELPKSYLHMLQDMPSRVLAQVLISGYHTQEDMILFDPIPNFIFTRDIAVTLNQHVVITKAAKEARHRENLLTRFIFRTNPRFQHLHEENRLINLNTIDLFPPSRKGEVVSVEGGDVMLLSPEYVLIGCSERTNAYGIESLGQVLLEKGVVKNVVQVDIPAERSFMHIDTLFTQIDQDVMAAYKPVVSDGLGSAIKVRRIDGTMQKYPSLKTFILEEINPHMRFVYAGKGESPYQEREQWTDGCNLVALKPGVAITYDRNTVTELAFKEAGFQIMKAADLLQYTNSGAMTASELEKTIITIPSHELSRARGGSHCMTCPIERG